jgi:hypothetical protein
MPAGRNFLTQLSIALLTVVLPWAPVVAEHSSDSDALSDYLTESGKTSPSGWRTAAIQIEENRYLVVQLGESGDIYQLANFDGMYVRQLRWKDDALLQVDWQSPDGREWRSRVRLDDTGNADRFEIVDVRQRSEDRIKHGPNPDMVDYTADVRPGSYAGSVTPVAARPYQSPR